MKKSIRRLLSILMVMLIVLGNNIVALADVAFEPVENRFLSTHSDKCYSEERIYIVDGPEGEVAIYKSPEDLTKIGKLANGERVCIYFIYDGKENDWGYVEVWNQDAFGWVPMSYMQEQYDAAAFRSQFGDEIRNENWDLKDEFCDKDIYVWDFPASNMTYYTLVVNSEDNFMGGEQVYTDEYGNDWGYFSYYYGSRGWICLNNPTASYGELYPDGGPEYKLASKTDSNTKLDTDNGEKNNKPISIEPEKKGIDVALVIIGILVVVVVVSTIMLIVLLGKNKKNKQ